MQLNDPHSAGGQNRPFAQPPLMADINVTPFVDVMLVLLIIFMITAPMVTTGLEVDLPQTRAKSVASDQKPLEIAILDDGSIYIDDEPVAPDLFPAQLQAVAAAQEDPAQARVFVRAASGLDYGFVVSVVSQVADAGFVKVTFLTQPGPGPAVADGQNRTQAERMVP